MKRLLIVLAMAPLATALGAQTTPAAAPIETKSGSVGTPPAGKGQVVFFRPGSMIGAALGCTVHEGEREVARLGSGKYYVVTAEPGKHLYFTQGEVKDKLTLEVEPDDTYFVKCNIGMGIASGRANLSPSTREVFATKAKGLAMWKGPKGNDSAPAGGTAVKADAGQQPAR